MLGYSLLISNAKKLEWGYSHRQKKLVPRPFPIYPQAPFLTPSGKEWKISFSMHGRRDSHLKNGSISEVQK